MTTKGFVRVVDLGVIDIPSLFTGGPRKLYTMRPNEYLASIRFTDTDFVAPDAGTSYAAVGIGTVKSFGWASFALAYTTSQTAGGPATIDHYVDTLSLADNNYAYDPAMAAGSGLDSAPATGAMILSAAAAGDLYASVAWPGVSSSAPDDPWQSPVGKGWRVQPQAWTANASYGFYADGPTNPGDLLANIAAAGHLWFNSGAAGTSGNSAPDFAGNIGGIVTDGPDVVWFDMGTPCTVGQVHAVAQLWVP